MASYAVLARYSRRATSVCVAALLILILVEIFVTPRTPRTLGVSFVLWAAASLPLLIFLPGMKRQLINSFAWLSFVSLLYFLYGVLVVFTPSPRWVDVLHLVFAVALFLASMLSVRYTARARRANE
ncbi:MAG: DUF2069 domain-containing protein [Spongiibacteraceae bacterium]